MRYWSPINNLLIPGMLLFLASCSSTPYPQGEALYRFHCANCHMDDGSGLARLIPPLAGADYLEKQENQVACLIRYGRQTGVIVNGIPFNEPMPGVRDLSETEITNIINYIRTSWGNTLQPVTLEQVTRDLGTCPENRRYDPVQ